MLCLLVVLYRSSPFVFSLLVSASPVLVCTAVLLGTLLSFGQPNIPEIEREEKINHEIASLRTEAPRDAIVVEQNESYSMERVTYEEREAVALLSEELNSATNRTSGLNRSDGSDPIAPLIQERSWKMELENEVTEGGGRELDVLEFQQKNTMHNERLGGEEAKTEDEDLELENDKSPAESFDSERVNVDSLDSPPGSPWKHLEEAEEQEEEEDEADDSGSDRAESSSPDASMADIMPMLDELHPLLDEDSPPPVPLSHEGSDAASERSARSSDSGSESDDNIEKHEELEAVDEDNEDADDYDEAQGTIEDQTKSAITWTEEDQKNLMDLGSSELERNQRLESLIARRRARKTMSLIPERNLIDLESVDLAFNIAPISTARNNPFDLPHDSYDNVGLPPIPGSAPSILSQRRNPFDLPYDSSEEKPDLMGDSFQQEFKSFQPKEPLFRRHESFNVGPSFFGPGRQDRQESRFRPYFVPERTDAEGTSYSPSFERQFSGLSESKTSSVPETDSVVSAGDIEDKILVEEEISHPEEILNSAPEIELRSPDRELEDKSLFEEDATEEPELVLKKEDRNLSGEDMSQGTELISKIDHVSEHVGHGSQSSEEVDSSDLGEVEKTDIGTHPGNHPEVEQRVLDERDNLVEHNQNKIHLKEDLIKHVYRSASSSSSLSEVSERIFTERYAEGLSGSEERRNDIMEDAEISRRYSLEGSDFGSTSVLVGDTPQKEPVYDTSPPAGRKNLSPASSMSSDVHVEAEMGLPPVLIKRTVSFADRESESSGHDIEKKLYDKEISAHSSLLHPSDENRSESIEAEISEYHILKLASQADEVAEATGAPAVPESTLNYSSVASRLSVDTAVEGNVTFQPCSHDCMENRISSSVNVDTHDAVQGGQHQSVSSEDQDLAQSEEQLHTAFTEQVLYHNVPSNEDIYTVEHSVDKEVAFQPGHGQTLPSTSDTDFWAAHSVEPEEMQVQAQNRNTSEGKAVSEFDEELDFLDKSMDETSSRDTHKVREPSVIQEGIVEGASARENTNVSGVQEVELDVSLKTYSPASPESISVLSEAYESRLAEGNSDTENNTVNAFNNIGLQPLEGRNFSAEAFNSQVDVQNAYDVEGEIREIDEALLSELDTVGDFSVKEYGSGFDSFEKHVTSGGESSSVPHMMKAINRAIDDNSTKLHERQPIIDSESWSSLVVDIDTQGEQEKSGSGPQTSGTSAIQHADVSSGNQVRGEVQCSNDLKPTEMVTLPSESEIELENSRVVLDSNVDMNLGMPVVEARSIEDIESMFRKAEVSLVKNETMLDGSEMPPEYQISAATSSALPFLEARNLEDIDSAFKQRREKETKKPNITGPFQVLQVSGETNALGPSSQEQHQGSSLTEPRMELPIVTPKPVEDDDFDLNQPYEEGNMDMLPGSFDESLDVLTPTPSELLVMESRYLENVNVALEGHLEKVLVSNSSSRSRVVETNEEGTSSYVKLSAEESHASEISQSDENLVTEVEKPVLQSNAQQISQNEENMDAEIEKPVVQSSSKELPEEISKSHKNMDAEVEKPDMDLSAKELHTSIVSKRDENSDAKVEKPETSITDSKGKRRKSQKASSSSSSSSSDSDKE